jgi:hypothetical protein
VARYRSKNALQIDGLYSDIVVKVPHLYGAVEAFLGTYRQICANGLAVGFKFASFKVKHLGNPLIELDRLIPGLVAQNTAMQRDIELMQRYILTSSEVSDLALKAARIRLDGLETTIHDIDATTLYVPRRVGDQKRDLWTVFNVIQENLMRSTFRYRILRTVNNEARVYNASTRRMRENSVAAIELNRKLWDLALERVG